jgi:hypothetical protein
MGTRRRRAGGCPSSSYFIVGAQSDGLFCIHSHHSRLIVVRRGVLALLLAILYYCNSRVYKILAPAPISPPLHTPSEFLTTLEERLLKYTTHVQRGEVMKFRINFLAIWPNAYRPAGWSIMDIFKGVVYVVSDDPDSVPDVENMYSN